MSRSSLIVDTADRLQAAGVFSAETIQKVASFANTQAQYKNYKAFSEAAHIPTPRLYVNNKGEGVPVVDVAAAKPQKGVIVMHLPMANPLDENQLFNVATIVLTHPEYRVIAFGNPSGPPYAYKEQNLTFWKRFGIASIRRLEPLVRAELDYLQEQGIENAHFIGYSYGAHKALIEASYAVPGTVRSLTLIDPVAHPRGLKQLIENFKSTFHPMGNYVDRTKIPSYFDARREAAKTQHHKAALRRQINIAIGFMMAKFDILPYLEKFINTQPSLKVVIAWGVKSELGNDALISTRIHHLKYDTKANIHSLRLKDDTHAFANDVHLFAAIIIESLSR